MSQTSTSEPDGYAHCNGSIKDNIKANAEKGATTNGIHIFSGKQGKNCMPGEGHQKEDEEFRNGSGSGEDSCREATDGNSTETSSRDKHEEKKLHCEDDKSTNELIDEFSTAMALSLIHSSNSEGFGNAECPPQSSADKDALSQTPSLETGHVDTNNKSITCDDVADSAEAEPTATKTSNSENLVMEKNGVAYVRYESELQMPAIMQLITKDLSEPYSIYTYRYFIHNWPHLCFLAMFESNYVGAIVCKLDLHKKITRRGYIAMLAVDQSVRRRNIGTSLVKMAIETMNHEGCDEVVLETEVTNKPALKLYENLGFVRDKRLFRYYLNGVDALRLKLWLR